MERSSLIFMPDISGFTKFVRSVEIEHSQHIISELLELLIDQNEIDLELAEVEGDALFYYKHHVLPSPDEVIRQAARMYRAFHKHLSLYETNRICQCGACSTAGGLKLKFIVHGGAFDFIRIKELVKPHGAEVIKAHRLLKNKVEGDEYLLISDDLKQLWESGDTALPTDYTWASESELLDLEDVRYWYAAIDKWKEGLADVPVPSGRGKEVHLFSSSKSIQMEPKMLFELVSNLKYRESWTPGVDKIEFPEGKVNRAGVKHVCVIGDRLLDFETLRPETDDTGQLVYAERTKAVPGFKYADFYFKLTPEGKGSFLEVQVLGCPTAFWSYLLKPVMARQMKKQMDKQLSILKAFAEART